MKQQPKLSNICIKCGVDLYATEDKFICQKHPKECKGIYLSEETLLTHAAEQKQHLIDMMKSDEELGLYEESKQETTLEEAAERFYHLGIWTEKESLIRRLAFINGAIYQAKRSYSDKDMKSFGDWCRNGLLNTEYGVEKLDVHLEQWKQFKK